MAVWKGALLVLVTAVVLLWIPRLFKTPRPIVVDGAVDPKWKKVEDTFRSLVSSGLEQGGSFAVYYRGRPVVHLYGGYADEEAGVPWKGDTLSCFFSSTKAVAGAMVAILVDRGLLSYDDPVIKYWPEFGQNGKDKVTVRELASHQAGIPAFNEPFSLYQLADDFDEVARIAAEAKPLWKIGEGSGYHSVTLGIFFDQLVRRVDPKHRNISQFFEDEVRKPFNIDFYIGLPRRENYRVARYHDWTTLEMLKELIFNPEWLPCWGEILMGNKESLLYKSMKTFKETLSFNDPRIRAVPLASGIAYGTSEAMAKFWGILANGGEYEGQKLMDGKTVKLLSEPVISGHDKVIKMNLTFGVGTMLLRSPEGSFVAGAPGQGGQMGYMDISRGLGWAYLTNYPSIAIQTPNYKKLLKAVYEVVTEL